MHSDTAFGLFVIGALVFIVVFLGAIPLLRYYNKNRKQPVIATKARVVAKRMDVTSDSSSYYVTFEGEAGERREFPVSGSNFGLLVEGDAGILTRQGAWFRVFKRQGVAVRR